MKIQNFLEKFSPNDGFTQKRVLFYNSESSGGYKSSNNEPPNKNSAPNSKNNIVTLV